MFEQEAHECYQEPTLVEKIKSLWNKRFSKKYKQKQAQEELRVGLQELFGKYDQCSYLYHIDLKNWTDKDLFKLKEFFDKEMDARTKNDRSVRI